MPISWPSATTLALLVGIEQRGDRRHVEARLARRTCRAASGCAARRRDCRTDPSSGGRSTCRRRAARWSRGRSRTTAPRRSARRSSTTRAAEARPARTRPTSLRHCASGHCQGSRLGSSFILFFARLDASQTKPNLNAKSAKDAKDAKESNRHGKAMARARRLQSLQPTRHQSACPLFYQFCALCVLCAFALRFGFDFQLIATAYPPSPRSPRSPPCSPPLRP